LILDIGQGILRYEIYALYSKKGRDYISVIVIIVLTFLVGIETRPQSNVSLVWLAYFFVVLISEIATIPIIYKRSNLWGVIGILAAILNILFIVADQAHLLQLCAPLSYSILQSIIVIGSILLHIFLGLCIEIARDKQPLSY